MWLSLLSVLMPNDAPSLDNSRRPGCRLALPSHAKIGRVSATAQRRRRHHGKGRTKCIESIAVGDWVWCTDLPSNHKRPGLVTSLFRRSGCEVLDVTLHGPGGSVERIAVTPEHPFHLRCGRWVPAQQLREGDVLSGFNGREPTVVAGVGRATRTTTVYNFEVDRAHNYFVGRRGVLVHNHSRLPGTWLFGGALAGSMLVAAVQPDKHPAEEVQSAAGATGPVGLDSGTVAAVAKELLHVGFQRLGVRDKAASKALASAAGDTARLVGKAWSARQLASAGGYNPVEVQWTVLRNGMPRVVAGAASAFFGTRAAAVHAGPATSAALEAGARSTVDSALAWTFSGAAPSFAEWSKVGAAAGLGSFAKNALKPALAVLPGPLGELAGAAVKSWVDEQARETWREPAMANRGPGDPHEFRPVIDDIPGHRARTGR